MNPWQILKQIEYLLKAQKWGSSSTVVFQANSVKIAGGDELQVFAEGLISPSVIIKPGASNSDPLHGEEPDLIAFSFSVLLIVNIPGDRVGSNAIMGASRQGLTDSRGKGILEVEEELLNAIYKLNDKEGIRVQCVETGGVASAVDPNNMSLGFREYLFEAQATADRFYHAPTKFAGSVAGSTVTLTWEDPPVRFDSINLEIHRASGSTPPATPTSATLVSTVNLGVKTYSDTGRAAGNWSYAIFAGYNERGGAASERYSSQETGTTTTETV